MEIIKEDVPYQLHQLLDIIGNDKFLEICKMYGGTNVYIPMYKNIIIGGRNRELIRDYNGKNIDMLRARCGISRGHMRKILHEAGVIKL
ncbi:MAG: Mor transcription activator family protein [Terrisporobacter sp.]